VDDAQLLRYSRHILLDELGVEGQQRLIDSHALILGAGGLGSPVALYLAASGVGRITLIDDERGGPHQLAAPNCTHHRTRRGNPRWNRLATPCGRSTHVVQVQPLQIRADETALLRLVAEADVVIDGCDNFATRHAVNRACVQHAVPLVSGAVIRLDGQLTTYDTRDAASPCYACLFPPDQAPEEVRCSTLGVLAPLVGVIGTLQATEAIKLLAGVGRSLVGRLQLLDGRSLEWTEMRLRRQPDCPVCQHRSR